MTEGESRVTLPWEIFLEVISTGRRSADWSIQYNFYFHGGFTV